MSINRYHAFGIHLLGSALIGLLVSALVFWLWYPAPLAAASGVTDIFLLLLMVDVTLGPLLTLIVFNPAKRELKRDLLIILLIQLSALIYGLHTVFVARPVYIVFSVGRFDLVFANDLTDEKLAKAKPLYQSIPLFGPLTIGAQMPEDPKAKEDILFSAVAGGDDLPQMPQYYVSYGDKKDEVIAHLQPLEKLNTFNPTAIETITALQNKYANHKSGTGFVPLRAKAQDMAMIIDRENAEVLEIADLRPW